MENRHANLFIRYIGTSQSDDSEINLSVLGESIIGFDTVIKDIFQLSKINGNVKANINQTREGSLIIDIVLTTVPIVNALPFDNVQDLLSFLKITNESAWNGANDFFDFTKGEHRTLNDYFAENPLDLEIMSNLITFFIGYIIGRANLQKQRPDLNALPKKYAVPVHRMIKNGSFKKAVSPFFSEDVTSIEVSSHREFIGIDSAMISQDNFDDYLSEDEKIIPDYVDGETYGFTGKIMALQSTRGDSATFQVDGFPSCAKNLIMYPMEGDETKDLEGYYKEQVVIKAVIIRDSLYKKPKLQLVEINKQNIPLNI